MAILCVVLWLEPLLRCFFANLPTQLKSIPNWRVNKVPRISSLVNVRAALGQLIGHEAPAGHVCGPCARGNGPFDGCRVVFLLGSGFQWSLACACCQYSGAVNKCSFRESFRIHILSFVLLTCLGTSGDASDPPRWLYDVVSQFQPNSVLLKDPGLARYEAASKVIKKAKTGTVVPAPAADKGKGKEKDKGKGKDQAAAGPSTPGKSPKKRAAEDSPGEKDKTGKKKKKTKEVPEPPVRVDATPHTGLTFDSVLY